MSELKAYYGDVYIPVYGSIADAKVYLKSEADKVIAHHKYKRCLDKAEMCDEVMMSCELRGYTVHRIWANKHQWAMRWKYRWLELAKKFKEAK